MAWTVDELRRWLDEVEPGIEQRDLFAWLDLSRSSLPTAVQPAFHEVARSRHPDLWRLKLPASDHDRLVRIYARIAAAYAELRDPARCAAYAAALGRPGPGATSTAVAPPSPTAARSAATRPPGTARARGSTRPPVAPTAPPAPAPAPTSAARRTPTPRPSGARPVAQVPPPAARPPAPAAEPGAPIEPARAMNARALGFYRRAEGALRVGDRSAALLHLKMAMASDPASTFLRAALRELMGER